MIRATLSFATIAFLAACGGNGVSQVPAVSSAVPPGSPNAGPGATLVTPQKASQMFTQVCVTNLPDFQGVPSTLAAMPFTQNSNTETYYHDSLDLSFSTSHGDCSLVFGSSVTTPIPEFRAAVIATGLTSTEALLTRPVIESNGATYMNARLRPNP